MLPIIIIIKKDYNISSSSSSRDNKTNYNAAVAAWHGAGWTVPYVSTASTRAHGQLPPSSL